MSRTNRLVCSLGICVLRRAKGSRIWGCIMVRPAQMFELFCCPLFSFDDGEKKEVNFCIPAHTDGAFIKCSSGNSSQAYSFFRIGSYIPISLCGFDQHPFNVCFTGLPMENAWGYVSAISRVNLNLNEYGDV